MIRVRAGVLLLVVLGLAGPAAAQRTTGEIIGRVILQLPHRPPQQHTWDERIAAVARRQHALITIWQLLAIGLDTSAGKDAFLTHGYPEPHVNTDLHGYEVDFHWPEHRLVVEIDGGGHSPRHDTGRDRVLHANGYSVLRLAA